MTSSEQRAQDQTRTYDRRTSVVFCKTQEAFGGLSNMAAGFPLVVNGVAIRTSEALYQACRFPHRPEVQRLIIAERSPMTAKMRGKPHRRETRPDWDAVRVSIMRWCLRVKLAQNWREFGDLLLATGERPIVEESRRDDYWGAKVVDPHILVGVNVLGRLLMELREELRSATRQLRRVEPPNVPDFRLYGQPVGVIAGDSAVPVRENTPAQPLLDTAATSATPARATATVPERTSTSTDWSVRVIPKECKRLAEVDFPVAIVSKHARAEKDSRVAHIPRLHVWPAARPGGACRSVMLALLLPDPCDPDCPADFKAGAARALLTLASRPERWSQEVKSDEGLRQVLFEFIGQIADWGNAHHAATVRCAQALISAAHGIDPPLVADPFAGGGVIPLEALRLGCDAVSTDLNPVALLIQSVVLELMPRHIDEMIETLPAIAASIRAAAQKELGRFYPKDPDGNEPAAYLWARCVRCEAPNCGAEIPLVRSFWLAKRAHRRRALRFEIVRSESGVPKIALEVFEPRHEDEVPGGTVSRAKAKCPCCGIVLSPDRVRAQLVEQRGGGDTVFDERGCRRGGALLLAVASVAPGEDSRSYRTATDDDYRAVFNAHARLAQVVDEWRANPSGKLCPVPNEPTPRGGGSGAGRAFSVYRYGMTRWADVFTSRQTLAMAALCRLIHDSAPANVRPLVALLISKVIDLNNSLTVWHNVGERPAHMLSRWAIPMKWDFVEPIPISQFSGSLETALARTMHLLREFAVRRSAQLVAQADASEQMLPDESVAVWFTDPPYYDAIPYADLSDFFFVWLRRAVPEHPLLRDRYDPANPLTPKVLEAVQDEQSNDRSGHPRDKAYFETKMREAFVVGRRVLREDGIGSVVFAHKTTEGWEALLSGMIAGGWTITGSWPLATEMSSRLRARDSAALDTSIHLICRPRSTDAAIGDWGEVLRELPRRVAEWMDRLQGEGVRGADLVFACIGPALEIYSRYSKVVDPQEREIPLGGDPEAREPHLRGYLAYVWEVVGRAALNQILGTAEASARNGAAGALEEDARLTALFLWTLQATAIGDDDDDDGDDAEGDQEEPEEDDTETAGLKRKKKGFSLIYDVARRFAQPLGIHMEEWEKRIIETEKGVVRLLPVLERAEQLFGEDGASAVADRLEQSGGPAAAQLLLFPQPDEAPRVRGRGRRRQSDVPDEALRSRREATTLDRVHAAMLLQASGRANALRALLTAEVDRGPDFLRLANALSALYPAGSDEKRLVDAMLLAVPR